MEDKGVLDYVLFDDLSEYLKYRRDCFNNYVQYQPNIYYDKIINARYSKVSRIKKRLLYLLLHRDYVYFLTFTFDDTYLNTHGERSKKDLIKTILKNFDDDILIILNKDFGSLKQREHYHAIVGSNNSSDMYLYLKSNYPFIFYKENVNFSSLSIKRLSKYINKLSNHCIKESTNKSRLYFNFKGYDDKNLDPMFYRYYKNKYNL